MQRKSPHRLKKEARVETLRAKIEKAKSLIFTDHSGLSMGALQELRRNLQGTDAEYVITKNALLSRALIKAGKTDVPPLIGPTATLFAYGDEVAPLKALVTFAESHEKPTLKLGYLGTVLLHEARMTALAALPTKEVLRAQLVRTVASPIHGLFAVLQGNMRGLVSVLSAIQQKSATIT